MKKSAWGLFAAAAMQTACPDLAAEEVRTLALQPDFRLAPANLIVPANTGLRLILRNDSPEAERFGSDDLNVERAVRPGEAVEISLGPLKAGIYQFFGYLHKSSARAEIIAR